MEAERGGKTEGDGEKKATSIAKNTPSFADRGEKENGKKSDEKNQTGGKGSLRERGHQSEHARSAKGVCGTCFSTFCIASTKEERDKDATKGGHGRDYNRARKDFVRRI